MLAIDWLALALTLAIVAVAIDISRYKPGRDDRKSQEQAEGAGSLGEEVKSLVKP
jgi:hypothetical protein